MSEAGTAFDHEVAARLGSYLKRAERAVMSEKARVLVPLGLTVPQYSALLFLHHTPDASAAQLSRACLVTPQTMATILGNLEQKGLVVRSATPVHLRVRPTRLTAAGEHLIRLADLEVQGIERRVGEQFTDDEFRALARGLEKVCSILEREGRSES